MALCLGLAIGCNSKSPISPDPVNSAPAPQSAAPQAVLRISPGPEAPLGAEGYTPFVFDATGSTGDGLSYRIDFGDGQQATTATASHVAEAGERTARLTVTDSQGRTATTEQKYFAAEVENRSGTFWFASLDGVRAIKLYLTVDGANVTGWLEMSRDNLRNVPIAGSLSGDRNLALRSSDGTIEMSGSLTWSDSPEINFSQARVRMRLAVRGGPADGATVLMHYADPF